MTQAPRRPPIASPGGTTTLGSQAASPAPAAPPADDAAPVSAAAAELEILIRARYPLLQVITWEEERVLSALGQVAGRLKKQLVQWSISTGLTRYLPNAPAGEGQRGTKDPLVALKEIRTAAGDPTIFVLKDFHAYLEEPAVVRTLRDLAAQLRSTYSTIVLVGPRLVIPPELEKELNVVDFPLPDRRELLQFLDGLAEELRPNPALRFENTEETRLRLTEAALGLTMNETENVFARILVRRGQLTAAEVPDVYHEKRQIIRKSGVLEYIDPEESIERIGGLASLKDWLRKRRRAFHPKARQFGLPMPKGAMILGVQGCGKSLAAKAVSRFWQMPLLRLDMGQLFSSLVGASEENVRRATRIAESIAPVILWIDEIDKGFSGLASSSFSDAGTTSRVFGTLLTWLQEKKSPVFVIATANNVEVLPPELMRQGRFDEIFFVDLPSEAERRDIFSIHLTMRRRNPARFDLDALAQATDGFSGAEIEQAVISGLYDAFDAERDVDQAILLHAIGQTRPLSVLMSEEIERRRAWARGRTRPAS